MQKVILSATNCHHENAITSIELLAEDDMTKPEVIHSIKQACEDFCQTPDGQMIYKQNHQTFTYADFDNYVPNNICKKYGIEKWYDESSVLIVELDTQLVSQETINNKPTPLHFDFPYPIHITSAKEARDVILHMCEPCPHWSCCSGATAIRCNSIKEHIKHTYSKKET